MILQILLFFLYSYTSIIKSLTLKVIAIESYVEYYEDAKYSLSVVGPKRDITSFLELIYTKAQKRGGYRYILLGKLKYITLCWSISSAEYNDIFQYFVTSFIVLPA